MIKVAIIGPESTGKTELATSLAKAYEATFVPEFSRQYLSDLRHEYNQHDLLKIAKGQLASEKEAEKTAKELLISDTDMHVMKVWSDYKYGDTDPWILNEISAQNYDLYILTFYDIPYEEDPLRENPEERAYFFDIYHQLLMTKALPFVIVKGDRESRLETAKEYIDSLL